MHVDFFLAKHLSEHVLELSIGHRKAGHRYEEAGHKG
jgi:hypothetical protein